MLKTDDEIRALCAQWTQDACWDLADTEGFEAYREQLAAYQKDQEWRWAQQREREVREYAARLNTTNAVLARHILSLEQRLEALEQQVNERESRS